MSSAIDNSCVHGLITPFGFDLVAWLSIDADERLPRQYVLLPDQLRRFYLLLPIGARSTDACILRVWLFCVGGG